jgi:two-component system, OmpR family, sensor kinase
MRRWLAWFGALLPAIMGVGFALLFQSSESTNLIFKYEVDLGTVLLLLGVAISVISLGFMATSFSAQRRQRRAVEDERSQAAEAHRRFIRRLDHELKNPLTAMRIGLADLSVAPLKPEQQKMVAGVGAQAERLGRLAADLRKLAELETRPLERSLIEVGPMLEEIVELAQASPAASERRITLSVPRAPWPLPPVPGDRDLVFLAIYNLVDNALKFTRASDTVEIRASEDGAGVVVEVADTGLGVPEDEQPHIFEELYRGQEARGIAGSGLGLALVKAVAERHGGAVAIRSRPGKGSMFSFMLPTGPA